MNNKDTGLVVLWVKLKRAGYTRTVQGLYHVMVRLGIYKRHQVKEKSTTTRSTDSKISRRKSANRC